VTGSDLPDVPAGTTLRLAGDEWSHGKGLVPGTPLAMTVACILPWHHRADDEVWVAGHPPECGYATCEGHPPCLTLLVKVKALWRVVSP
jgi:hypothetical protein